MAPVGLSFQSAGPMNSVFARACEPRLCRQVSAGRRQPRAAVTQPGRWPRMHHSNAPRPSARPYQLPTQFDVNTKKARRLADTGLFSKPWPSHYRWHGAHATCRRAGPTVLDAHRFQNVYRCTKRILKPLVTASVTIGTTNRLSEKATTLKKPYRHTDPAREPYPSEHHGPLAADHFSTEHSSAI